MTSLTDSLQTLEKLVIECAELVTGWAELVIGGFRT